MKYVYKITITGTEAQRKGVIRSTVYVTFTPDFIKKLIETTDGTIWFNDWSDGRLTLCSDKYGDEHVKFVEQEIKKIAIAKTPDTPSEIYEVTIDATDFNFNELSERITQSKRRIEEIKSLREALNNLIEQKKEIAVRTYASEIKLINGKRIIFDINNPDSLRNAIAELQNLNEIKLLHEALQQKIKELDEATKRIENMESEIRNLRHELSTFKRKDDDEDDDC
jgi:prefoldin subunit 5